MGLWPLRSHQAGAIDALRRGDNVMVATQSASGKSLCYNVPVLESLLQDSACRALYLFPTKALAQDQLRSFAELSGSFGVRAAIYDGDTPTRDRPPVRKSARVVLTNPDMLHLGILPRHQSWDRLFRGLGYVVVDECHTYRGVFGSHVANILRRLRRVCQYYGSSPQFILCSATIGNAGELAHGLTGLSFEVIDEDGSPSGGKRFALWNPPIMGDSGSTRRSANVEAASLFSELVSSGVRTIVFTRTRRATELVYVYARDRLSQDSPEVAASIRPYRGSYLPEDRRSIERALFSGELLGVTSTNALELGIDVGSLDATVLAGYPGSIASTWQQAGRSGRRGEESLTILVGRDNPLDQYIMNHPQALFGRSVEHARISPSNPYVIEPHLLCAAYELPLKSQDQELFGADLVGHLEKLEAEGRLRRRGESWHISPQLPYPANDLNIRSISSFSYQVIQESTGAVLENVGEPSAFQQLHPGAVYLHQGEPYLVRDLDLDSHIARVERSTDDNYYTEARELTDIRVSSVRSTKSAGGVEVSLGDVEVTSQVLGFRRRRHLSERVIDEEPLDLPERRFPTVALWFDVPDRFLDWTKEERRDLPGGLHAAEHAAIGVLPLFAMCDRNDIGGVSTPLHPDTGRAQVFIYDGHAGGAGIAERGYQIIEALWEATLEAMVTCHCDDGCPGCVQSPKCGNNNHPLDKHVAMVMLRFLVGDPAASGIPSLKGLLGGAPGIA